ncbi:MAG TPA: AAA-like domain-containing protein [Crinalium sp.]|jgi:hypothetical protein
MVEPGIYTVGGTVQANERGVYIPRHADQELLNLCRQGEFAYVLTPRQMGKSSLMIRTATQLIDEGSQAVIIDLTQIGTQVSAAEWYRGLLTEIADQLMLSVSVSEWWQAHDELGVTQRLTRFFQQVVLKEVQGPVVIFVDEIDTTLSLDFTDDFYAAIRYLYVARATQPAFRRLSFVLIGVATPGDLIRDAKRTPFNIGHRVDLTDFTLDEALPLAAGLGLLPHHTERVMTWVLKWTGGHPYLTKRLCQAIAQVGGDQWTETEVNRLVASTFLGRQSEQDNNLQFVRDMLTKRALEPVAVLRTYREIRRGKLPVLDEEQSLVKTHLKLSGVVRREGRSLQVRNPIYYEVFDWDWIKTHLPETLWQRLKPALPVILALLIGLIGMAGMTVYAFQQQGIALAQKHIAEQQTELANNNAAEAKKQQQRAEDALSEVQKQQQRAEAAASRERKQAELARSNATEARKQQQRTEGALEEAREQTVLARNNATEARKQQRRAEDQTQIAIAAQSNAEQQTAIANLREKAAVVLNWLPTVKAVDGLVLAIQTVGESRDHNLNKVFDAVDSSLLSAVQTVKEENRFQGHTASVYSVAFSPDGQRIVSGSGDNTVRLWNLDGTPIGQPVQGHTASVYSVAFSPDGQRIVSGSGDNTVRLWWADWQGWLRLGCNFLRHHPVLVSPSTNVEREARATCQRYIWSHEGQGGSPESRSQAREHQRPAILSLLDTLISRFARYRTGVW